MTDKTKIEWTDATWTPIRARYWEIQGDGSGKERIGWHCEHVSEACRNCYAEAINRRLGTGLDFKPANLFREEKRGYNNGEAHLFLDEQMLLQPLRWKRPRRIFVCSMTDLFAEFVSDRMIDRIFAVMALASRHTFQVLTKREKRMREYLLDARTMIRIAQAAPRIDPVNAPEYLAFERLKWPLGNVWLGVSAEDQARKSRIEELRQTPAAVRFLSCEPLIEDLGELDLTGISWVIVGGESGPGARPMHPDWARSIRDQCQAAGVPFFFKQWGEWGPSVGFACDPSAREAYRGEMLTLQTAGSRQIKLAIPTRDDDSWPALTLEWLGKKLAGRLLDGRTHDEMPA